MDEEMFAVFIDAHHSRLRDENGKTADTSKIKVR